MPTSKGSTSHQLMNAQGTEALLRMSNLSVTFGAGSDYEMSAVKGISFEIWPEEKVALVGESGSGKTATALSILRLFPEGEALIEADDIGFGGQNLATLDEKGLQQVRGGKISMIFQEPMSSLNPLHTVGRQIGESISLHQNISGRDLKHKTETLLHTMGIDRVQERMLAYPHELSGGQRQRVMIAMAIANEPALLIADEPTTALDVTVQAQILEELERLNRERKVSVLLISHDLTLVRRFADRVAIMKEGVIVETGVTRDVFNNPQHPYTQTLLSSDPTPRKRRPSSVEAPLVTGEDVRVHFPVKRGILKRTTSWIRAVDGFDLSVQPGRTVGVVGESGSGKSTLALALLKLVSAQGTITFSGQSILDINERTFRPLRAQSQIVFQDPIGSLSPRMTVLDIVTEGLLVHETDLSQAQREEHCMETLEAVGLDPEARHRYPHEFSGGQRQRIAIARSLVLSPKFLILDEPTSALDLTVQKQIIDLLLRLQEERGLAYLFISHDLRVVRALADDLIVMRAGKIVEAGPADELFSNATDAYSQALIRAAFEFRTVDDMPVAK